MDMLFERLLLWKGIILVGRLEGRVTECSSGEKIADQGRSRSVDATHKNTPLRSADMKKNHRMKREKPTNPHFVRRVTTGIVVDSGIANCCLCNRKEGTDCF